ncbi:MAG: MATE family efflux transporter [Gemmatimonadota bacterium]|nr:MATE family efflux transporter [Gemmatimonadota bacterium]
MTTYRTATRDLVRLALPVTTVQVGMMTMGVVDTAMVGRVGAADLAAVALGTMYFFLISILGLGILMAVDPIIAQGAGARDDAAVARGVQRGLLLAVVLGVVASLLHLPAAAVLALLHQQPEVVPIAGAYVRALIPGILPFFVFSVFRQSLQALHHTRALVIAIVVANVANVFLNWVFVFGHLGLPALGAQGAGIATSLTRWLMALGLLAAAWPLLRPLLLPIRPEIWQREPLLRIIRIGVPIGLHHELEFGAFGVTAVLMGTLGTVEMAAHQIALNIASITFMVPLGVGTAASVLVGQAVGRGDSPGARRAAAVSLAGGIGFMGTSAGVMVLFPAALAGIYTDLDTVLRLAVALIPIAGAFQVFDGIQVVSAGTLRGLGDTRVPMLIGLVGFWLIGLPVSVALAFGAGLGPLGLWWGLVAGLGAVAILLLVRVRVRFRGILHRVVIDDSDFVLPHS